MLVFAKKCQHPTSLSLEIIAQEKNVYVGAKLAMVLNVTSECMELTICTKYIKVSFSNIFFQFCSNFSDYICQIIYYLIGSKFRIFVIFVGQIFS